jgi:hypothetical protein
MPCPLDSDEECNMTVNSKKQKTTSAESDEAEQEK